MCYQYTASNDYDDDDDDSDMDEKVTPPTTKTSSAAADTAKAWHRLYTKPATPKIEAGTWFTKADSAEVNFRTISDSTIGLNIPNMWLGKRSIGEVIEFLTEVQQQLK